MEKPKCLYCGHEMKSIWKADRNGSDYWWYCPNCFAGTPVRHTEQAAYAVAVSHEMTALEFVREHHRMCQSGMECAECRICHDGEEPRSCAVLMGLNPDDTVAVVEKWAKEHPEERSEDNGGKQHE